MENTNNSYNSKVYCKNCDFRGAIDIPKGQTIEQTECINCGTLELIKDVPADDQLIRDYCLNIIDGYVSEILTAPSAIKDIAGDHIFHNSQDEDNINCPLKTSWKLLT